MYILFYIAIFLLGAGIGSFLKVCIRRNLIKEGIGCLVYRGCRKCGTEFYVHYPVVEAVNGSLYVMTVLFHGVNIDTLLCCLLVSALIVLSVVDFITYEIPFEANLFIAVLGFIRATLDYHNFLSYLLGFFAVGAVLAILYYATGGRAIGGGDVKLMAASGLFLGWKLIIVAFLSGCILGAVIHVVRMKASGEGHVLAMGPYLSAGIFIAAVWGDQALAWYLGQF